MGPGTIHTSMLQPRGAAWRRDRIVPHSHYHEPIDRRPGRLAGRSRVWGDADAEVQSRVIDLLLQAAVEAGLSTRDMALVLAIARRESGFNPDAAAGSTSAFGIGQFIDRTGARYGLDAARRGDAREQARALVAHYLDNRALAAARGQGEDHIYKYHHDGPVRDYGGLAISRADVLPHADRYEDFVRGWLQAYRATARNEDPPGAVLQEGDTGAAVRALQARLNAHGARDGQGRRLPLTGRFLRRTRDAVRAFQKARGLPPTGIADAVTREALAGPVATPSRATSWRAGRGPDGRGDRPGRTTDPGASGLQAELPWHLQDQARRHVAALDRRIGRPADEVSARLADAIAEAAHAAGFASIDEVRVSPDGWRAQAAQYSTPGARVASVDVFAAIAPVLHGSVGNARGPGPPPRSPG